MDFKLTEEQELLLKSVDEMIERECPESYIAECDRNHQPTPKVDEALKNAGLSMLGIPEEYGGTPADCVTLCLVGERVAAHGIQSGFGNMLPVKDILDFGNEEQKKMVLDVLKEGVMPFCLCITEPGSGSDDASMRTTAIHQGDGTVVINGQKTFITGAQTSPYGLLLTRDLNNPDPHKAISMWLVPMNTPGITVRKLDKVAWWTGNTCEVFFDNVRVPETTLVGKENNGFYQLMKNFEIERMLMCAMALGAAEVAYHDAARYANQRVQFGQPIGQFQQVQLMLTNMAVKIENMRNMVYKCAWMVDNHISVMKESAMCKLYCAQAGWEVVDDAMQIHGGLGLMMDCRIQRLWRDFRVNRIGAGTDQIMVNIVGRIILKEHR
jgi:crotonobetainyl-CoA dehydrogenase